MPEVNRDPAPVRYIGLTRSDLMLIQAALIGHIADDAQKCMDARDNAGRIYYLKRQMEGERLLELIASAVGAWTDEIGPFHFLPEGDLKPASGGPKGKLGENPL